MDTSDLDPFPHIISLLAEQFFIGISTGNILSLLLLVFLLISSGLISGSETAFFSLKPSDLETLRESNQATDNLILHLLQKPKKLLATILISNNFINVGIVILSTYISSTIFNTEAYPILFAFMQVVVITSLILILCEIAPKMIGNKEPLMFSSLMAKPLQFLNFIWQPISSILVGSTSLIDKKFAKKGHTISMSELSDAIEITVDDDAPEDEKMILKSIATFGEKEASEIMRSRVDITALDNELSFTEVLQVVKESGFSRIPVYHESLDHVLGILYVKDLLPFIDNKDKSDWTTLVRPAFYVPENKRINDLLQEFREKKIHLAVVVDEYGGTSGIVTLEDIVEEIVGEISDEFDKEILQFNFKRLTDNTYIFEAKAPLSDLIKIVGLEDDVFEAVRGESDSLGGLILELEGRMPVKGSLIKYHQFDFLIIDSDERRIKEVKLTINKEDRNEN